MTPALTERTAEHRPATRTRSFRHDDLVAVDLFSGFGGLTRGIEMAGFTTIMAANHNAYKVEVHEANHPNAEHWIADLVDPESSDYHSARDLPAADLLVAGVSCTNHSQANTKRAYEHAVSLFDMLDPEYEERVTRSERDRATANCVLHYAAQHHPRMILVECTTELQSWGRLVPGSRKVGDGSTYRWWLKQFEILGYRHRVLFLNSRFFDVDQSRDRAYWVFWDKAIPAPDLDHRPETWCQRCDTVVQAAQSWKTGIPVTGSVRYGKQYVYRCPGCRDEVVPPSGYSLRSLDLSDLGTRIGDRERPLAASTMARAERCRQRFAEFPAVLMPAKATRGSERHPWQPLPTQTSQQEAALLSTGAVMQMANGYERPGSHCRARDLSQPLWTQPASPSTAVLTPPVALAVANFQGAPRGGDEPLPTQGGSETLGMLSARVLPNRTNGTSRGLGEPMETLVGSAGSGGLGLLSSGVVPFRRHTVPTTHAEAMPTVTSEQIPGLLTQTLAVGWLKQNGSSAADTAAHPLDDPMGTLTSRDTTALLAAGWLEALATVSLEDCYFRMMKSREVGRGCGFDVDFGQHQGTFKVWGSARDQVDGFGNAVSPQVGTWIGLRLRAVLHGMAP
ncbi:DNA cytosine methyltransferase [Sinomonas sp. JGH33]|uniref:DNA (cytosine-5-)-methyltransferase n=1 Tax=Sinomonas terricola TaxID=3110330 RepID=A0ABU5TBD9_9MICC|nr:DNA cytosine methyltransferase [Sinomonas sp. JGH33]MEA5456746.1 DNA cytosine methyltransferase [Sinomonas sp. JGH33]